MGLSLKAVLSQLNLGPLQALAKGMGMSAAPKTKDPVVAAIEKELTGNLPNVLKKLTRQEKLLLAETAHNDGELSCVAYRAKYADPTTLFPPSESSLKQPISLIWAFVTRQDGHFRMSDRMIEVLKAALPKPPPPQIASLARLPKDAPDERFGARKLTQRSCKDGCFEEAHELLKLISARKISVNYESSRPIPEAEQLVRQILAGGDFDLASPPGVADAMSPPPESPGGIRTHAWPVLAQQCGWALCSGSSQLVLTQNGRLMRAQPTEDLYFEGIERFLSNDEFDELSRVEGLKQLVKERPAHGNPPSTRRKAICRSIAEWPIGKWVSIDEAFRILIASGETNYRVTGRIPYYNSCGVNETARYYDREHVDRLYLKAFLLESMATLGLIDAAYVFPHYLWNEAHFHPSRPPRSFFSKYDGVSYARLNDFGAKFIRRTDRFGRRIVDPPALFTVLPNLEIVVLPGAGASEETRKTLSLVGQSVSNLVWRIDKESVLAALHYYGAKLSDLVRFLETGASQGLPETVRTFFDDIGRKVSAVTHVENTVIIEFSDAHIPAELAADRRTSKHCRIAHERSLVVSKKHFGLFQDAARKLGYVIKER